MTPAPNLKAIPVERVEVKLELRKAWLRWHGRLLWRYLDDNDDPRTGWLNNDQYDGMYVYSAAVKRRSKAKALAELERQAASLGHIMKKQTVVIV